MIVFGWLAGVGRRRVIAADCELEEGLFIVNSAANHSLEREAAVCLLSWVMQMVQFVAERHKHVSTGDLSA